MSRVVSHERFKPQRIVAVCIVAGVVCVGSVFFLLSHAATPYVSIEAVRGTLAGSAVSKTDTTASGGSLVVFGQAINTTAGLGTPLPCPSGSVQVSQGSVPSFQANTNYCFAMGTYGNFSATIPSGDGWYGQGKAILNGDNSQQYAIYNGGSVSGVVVDGFTILDYSTAHSTGSVSTEAVALHAGTNVTISDNTIGPTNTGAISFGSGAPTGAYSSGAYSAGVNDSTITHNYITQIGYSGTTISGGTNDVVSYNEVNDNDTFNDNTENDIAAIGKFAVDANTQVIGNNIHDSRDTAIWFDVFDVDSTVENNTIKNMRAGIFEELSCNAVIENNTISDVGYADSGLGDGAPGAAVRISSSGSSTYSGISACGGFNASGTMPGPQSITISSNTMTDNHEGISLFNGHLQYGNSGPPIPDNNIYVTGNTTMADTTGTGTASDAWSASVSNPGYNIAYSKNIYFINPLQKSGFQLTSGTTNFAGWQSSGQDTSGSTCALVGGGSC
jgi:hypothetical protein